MDPYIPLFSGLIGALIGAMASVITIIVQSHYQNKREMTKESISLALEDWKARLEIIKLQGGKALPLAVFIHYHTKLLTLAEQGKITPSAIKQLSAEQEELIEAMHEANEKIKN